MSSNAACYAAYNRGILLFPLEIAVMEISISAYNLLLFV